MAQTQELVVQNAIRDKMKVSSCISGLCLAQAQELVVQKAIRDKMKASSCIWPLLKIKV
jgi:hypothetical protein